MNTLRLLLIGLAGLTVPAFRPPSEAALPSTSPDAGQLYLTISNSSTSVFVTAYNTIPNVSYQIQTNTDVTNPNGWGAWVTVQATGTITPLSTFSADFKETFFRAASISQDRTAGSPPAAVQYLGRLDVNTEASQNSRFATLIAATNQASLSLPGWGQTADPDSDCNFYVGRNSVVISVPGSGNPHDLAAEIDRTNAPRLTQVVEGDFIIEVKTDGRFEPGENSTLPGRTAYNGAALIITSDPQNVVTLARAVLQRPGNAPAYYANFEMRSGGNLERMGFTSDLRLPAKGPVWLRLQRHGSDITGAVSTNGTEWNSLGAKTISSDWPGKLSAGIAAISTSESEFDPRFSELKVSK